MLSAVPRLVSRPHQDPFGESAYGRVGVCEARRYKRQEMGGYSVLAELHILSGGENMDHAKPYRSPSRLLPACWNIRASTICIAFMRSVSGTARTSTWLTSLRPLRNRKGPTSTGSICKSCTTSVLQTRRAGIIGRRNLPCWLARKQLRRNLNRILVANSALWTG
jgi:hypothetical protein